MAAPHLRLTCLSLRSRHRLPEAFHAGEPGWQPLKLQPVGPFEVTTFQRSQANVGAAGLGWWLLSR